MNYGYTIAGIAIAYMIGKQAGERQLMEEIKKDPPPPGATVDLSDEEVQAVIDLVPGPGGVYQEDRGTR